MSCINKVALLLLTILAACSAGYPESYQWVEKNFEVEKVSMVAIKQEVGTLSVRNSDNFSIEINGSITEKNNLSVEQGSNKITIIIEDGSARDELVVAVPDGISIEIATFKADVDIHGIFSEIRVDSTAGSIALNSTADKVQIKAGRGEIELTGESNNAVLIGEHGVISVRDFQGNVSMTSIMGTLEYYGIENDQNQVVLEVDHGPVKIFLPESANQAILVSTTSGYVTCMGDGLMQTVDGCRGQIGSGAGELKIRTVSGRVDLQVLDFFGD